MESDNEVIKEMPLEEEAMVLIEDNQKKEREERKEREEEELKWDPIRVIRPCIYSEPHFRINRFSEIYLQGIN